MKRLIIQSLVLFATVSLMAFSCDKASDLTTITSDQQFTTSFTLKSSNASGTFSTGFKKMDISDVEQYGDKLQDVTLKKVTVTIVNHNSADASASGNIKYSTTSDGSGAITLKSISDASASSGEIDLEVDQSTLENLAATIQNLNHDIYLEADGSYSGGPVDATITVNVYGTIKANPFN